MNRRRLYATLGLEIDADEVSLRRAFKRLSDPLSPEKNPDDPEAAGRLAQLRAAYEVLSDPERRALYDEFGEASLKKAFDPEAARRQIEKEKADDERRARAALLAPTAVIRQAATGTDGSPAPARPDWSIQVAIGPQMARHGGRLKIPVRRPMRCTTCDGGGRRERTCRVCAGSRQVTAKRIEPCAPCNGLGVTGKQESCKRCEGRGVYRAKTCKRCCGAGVAVQRYFCGTCHGVGLKAIRFEQPCGSCSQTGLEACPRCNGSGQLLKWRMFKLYVPSAVANAGTYRYAGAGFSSHQGEPTDLLVQYTVLPRAPRR